MFSAHIRILQQPFIYNYWELQPNRLDPNAKKMAVNSGCILKITIEALSVFGIYADSIIIYVKQVFFFLLQFFQQIN